MPVVFCNTIYRLRIVKNIKPLAFHAEKRKNDILDKKIKNKYGFKRYRAMSEEFYTKTYEKNTFDSGKALGCPGGGWGGGVNHQT